jgi:hypothetical protein
MTHVICRANYCLFWEQGVCTCEEIEYEPDSGCLTFQDMGDLDLEDEEDEDFDWDDGEDEDEDDDWDNGWEEEEDNWDDDAF